MKIIGDIMTSLFPIFHYDYRKQRKSFSFLIGCLFISVSGFGQSSLSGKVTDSDTGEPILLGDIILYQNEKLITGEQTDFDGNYIISPIDTGIYDVVFKYVGYEDITVEKVQILTDRETRVNAVMTSGISIDFPIIHNCGWQYPTLYSPSDFGSGQTFTSKQIRNLPNKN